MCYMLSFMDRQILSLLVGPIKRDLFISDTRVGLLQGLASALFYTLAGLPIGRLVDTRNRRNLVIAGVMVWSAFTCACSVARSYWSLFLVRIGVGVGEAALNPSAFSLIADYFPRERLGTAMSVFYLGALIGSGLAFAVGGMIVEATTRIGVVDLPVVGAVASWRLTFLVVGVPGILFGLLVATVREPARRSLLKEPRAPASRTLHGLFISQRKNGGCVAGAEHRDCITLHVGVVSGNVGPLPEALPMATKRSWGHHLNCHRGEPGNSQSTVGRADLSVFFILR
jgi:MFS family permease